MKTAMGYNSFERFSENMWCSPRLLWLYVRSFLVTLLSAFININLKSNMKSSSLHDIIFPAISEWKRACLILLMSSLSKVLMSITSIISTCLFGLRYITFSIVIRFYVLYVQSVLRDTELSVLILPEFQEYFQLLLIFLLSSSSLLSY